MCRQHQPVHPSAGGTRADDVGTSPGLRPVMSGYSSRDGEQCRLVARLTAERVGLVDQHTGSSQAISARVAGSPLGQRHPASDATPSVPVPRPGSPVAPGVSEGVRWVGLPALPVVGVQAPGLLGVDGSTAAAALAHAVEAELGEQGATGQLMSPSVTLFGRGEPALRHAAPRRVKGWPKATEYAAFGPMSSLAPPSPAPASRALPHPAGSSHAVRGRQGLEPWWLPAAQPSMPCRARPRRAEPGPA
jgi:hypothetical protein